MAATQHLDVTIPLDLAEAIEGRVKSGAYASVSEAVSEGLQALLERDAAMDQWLRDEVTAGHQEYLADPSKGIPAEDILAHIKASRPAR